MTRAAVEQQRMREWEAEQTNKRLLAFAQEHQIGMDNERAQLAAEFRRAKAKTDEADREIQVILEHEREQQRVRRLEEQAERMEREAREAKEAQSRAVSEAALKARILNSSDEIKRLREAIEAATRAKANQQYMQRHAQEERERRLREAEAEKAQAEREMEEYLRMQQLQFEEETRNREEQTRAQAEHARLHAQAVAEEKARIDALERETVRLAIEEALQAREDELQRMAAARARAVMDRKQSEEARARALAEAKELEAREEEIRIRYAREKDAQEEARRQVARARDQERDQLFQRMAAELAQKERQRAHLEELRSALAAAYEERKALAAEEAEAQKREETRQMLIQAQREAEEARTRLEAERRAEEDRHKRQIMEDYANSEAVEMANDRKRREMMLAFRKELEEQVEADRQQRKEEEVARRLEEKKLIEQSGLDEEGLRIVEEERRRLIHDYAANVLEFMPPGVLRDEDIQYFPEEVQEQVRKMKRERELVSMGADVSGMTEEAKRDLESLQIPDRGRIDSIERQQRALRSQTTGGFPW